MIPYRGVEGAGGERVRVPTVGGYQGRLWRGICRSKSCQEIGSKENSNCSLKKIKQGLQFEVLQTAMNKKD